MPLFIGTAMFALPVCHNVFNRRWCGTLAKRSGARDIAADADGGPLITGIHRLDRL